MGLINSFKNLKNWFTDKTGITGLTEGTKRKYEECETVTSKKARMDNSFVEVVEISDESLSEVEITKPGQSTKPLRANTPAMLINDQRRTLSPTRTMGLIESKDRMIQSIIRCFSSHPFKPHQNIGIVRNDSSSLIFDDEYSKTPPIKGKLL